MHACAHHKMTDVMTTEAVVPPTAPAAPPEPFRPVTAAERVETIDILRGLALFGILAANIRGFAGPAITSFLPDLFWLAMHDRLAQAFIDTFIQGKFITIFAFLFGVGFAVQLDRANERGVRFGRVYARRLFVLLLFGLVHGTLIWFGDILLVYALDGFLLLLFRKRQDTTLVIWAMILLLIMPVVAALMFVAGQLGVPLPDPTPKAAEIAAAAKTYETGTFLEVTKLRASDAVAHNWGFFPIFAWQVLALFLLGMLAWRRRLLQPPAEMLPRYRLLMWLGFGIGITGNAAITVVRWALEPSMLPTTWTSFLLVPLQTISVPALSLGYVCLVLVICQSEAWRARLHRFAAIGRTALTNYLLQSLAGTLIFYGYGLGFFGDAGPALLLPLTFLLFAAQMYVSPWWLARYRFGPVEWVWRRLTYGGPLAMRRERVVAAAAVEPLSY
jgi:uncharacterized protein